MVLKPQEVPEDVFWVLETYKLTWFSNYPGSVVCPVTVLDPYKLTWFSNGVGVVTTGASSFRSLQTYMVLKQGQAERPRRPCFRSLQTYMVLKPD